MRWGHNRATMPKTNARVVCAEPGCAVMALLRLRVRRLGICTVCAGATSKPDDLGCVRVVWGSALVTKAVPGSSRTRTPHDEGVQTKLDLELADERLQSLSLRRELCRGLGGLLSALERFTCDAVDLLDAAGDLRACRGLLL